MARSNLFHLFSRMPCVANKSIDLSSDLLSLGSLQTYCDLFFTKFNMSYPLVHQPTFDPYRVDELFFAAVVCMGATYDSREACDLAVGIYSSLRDHLLSHTQFSPQPELWELQTMLLIDFFGKQRAGHKQLDMAHLFHCTLVKMIRRSGSLLLQTAPTVDVPDDLESAWRREMAVEARKRVALLCFMWDTQQAVFSPQPLSMAAFEFRSSLPCDPTSWMAPTAEGWLQASRREQPHRPFLSVLKSYVTPDTFHRPQHLNILARMLLLTGLMSIASDLKGLDQTTLGAENPNLVGAWKSRVGRLYDLWKADFDTDLMSLKLDQCPDQRQLTGLRTACHATYHAAQLALNVEILDLQIYARAPHILGRAVTTPDFERAQRNMTRWVNDDPISAAKAARHASLILQDAVMNMHDWDDSDLFHYPWCLYLATLTCWAFHFRERATIDAPFSTNPDPTQDGENGNPLAAKNEMTTLVVSMTACNTLEDLSALAGKFDTSGLTTVMAQQLAGVEWVVVRDAMDVLAGLSTRS
jgi:hypothetical protein